MPGKYRFYLSAAWLTWILAIAIQRVSRAFPAPGAELNSDARWVYLPNARKLLETVVAANAPQSEAAKAQLEAIQ